MSYLIGCILGEKSNIWLIEALELLTVVKLSSKFSYLNLNLKEVAHTSSCVQVDTDARFLSKVRQVEIINSM